MRVLIAGGGTGGHVFPALAIAEALQQQEPAAQVEFFGVSRGLEARAVPARGFAIHLVELQGFAGQSLWRQLLLVPQLARTLVQALGLLRRFRPGLVLGVGGYASLPAVLAAGLLRIPVVLHEQNACPGLANRLAARWARCICVAMAEAEHAFGRRRVVLTGNPVRQELFDLPAVASTPSRLLVFGGSQGAAVLNRVLPAALALVRRQLPQLQVLHQTGSREVADVRQAYSEQGCGDGVEVVPFIEDMAAAYASASLVVCRAGATSIAELTACGRPAILIPLPTAAGDHQRRNAEALQRAGAARLLPQAELTAAHLAEMLVALLHNRAELAMMATQARALAMPQAAAGVARICLQLAKER